MHLAHRQLPLLALLPLLGACVAADGPIPRDTGGVGDSGELVAVAVDFGEFAPKNVVVIQVDTLRGDALPRWGNVHDTLPRLGSRPGWISVDREIATSTWTAPSSASLLSGQDPMVHGVRFFDETGTNPGFTGRSFVEQFADAGYDTALFSGSQILMGGSYGLAGGFADAEFVPTEPGNAAAVAKEAGQWLTERTDDGPFLLFLQPMDPHSPYAPEAEDVGTWSDPSAFPFELDAPAGVQDMQIVAAVEDRSGAERDELLLQVRALYDEQVLGVDRAIDGLFDALEAAGHLDDTLVVFTADHGDSIFDGVPAYLGHGIYTRNEVIHLPLMFWGAGLTDTHVPCLASNVDVFPTVLDAVGLPPMEGLGIEGRSLTGGCRELAFSSVYESNDGVERLTWLSVESLEAQVTVDCTSGELLAFDLVNDPTASSVRAALDVPGGAVLTDALTSYARSVEVALPQVSCEFGR